MKTKMNTKELFLFQDLIESEIKEVFSVGYEPRELSERISALSELLTRTSNKYLSDNK